MDVAKRPLFLEVLAEYEMKTYPDISLPGYTDFGRIDDAYRLANMHRDSDEAVTWWVLWEIGMAPFRQDLRFTELVTELGLIDYWREHGWPDACQPAGDSLNCE